MKLNYQSNTLPYNGEVNIYSQLEAVAAKVLTGCTRELHQITSQNNITERKNEPDKLNFTLEILTIGTLWFCHAEKASATRDSSLAEIDHLTNIANSNSSTEKLKTAFYTFRNQQLTSGFSNEAYPLELSVATANKLVKWLIATGEYKYEVKILKKWVNNWTLTGESIFLYEMNIILRCTQLLIDICDHELSGIYNKAYFDEAISAISKSREDYFQVTKSLPEYYLNSIGAVWMNTMNRSKFTEHKKRLVIAPGCMRPVNGLGCSAKRENEYFRCSKCNTLCNIKNLTEEGETNSFDVLFVLHQSKLKADKNVLKDKGVVGIACISYLVPGGLMLLENNIYAQCSILEQPGCKKHWTPKGEMTKINTQHLVEITRNYEPSTCNTSDS